jgi:sulfite exporter TauE/SafE
MGFLGSLNIGNPSLNLSVSFLVGLVASVSSCLAVVGAVIIAFAEKYKTEEATFWKGAMAPNLLFHIGRLIIFFVLGGVLGLIGGEINISGNFIAIYTIIIAVVMAWLGFNILGVIPPISKIGITLPKSLTSNWKKLENSEHKMAPVVLGGLSFFLPCGFTQSMQILALTSGSFWVGSLGLFSFALGTVPALLILGITTSWTKNKKIVIFKKVAGIMILIFAVYTFGSGLALKGVKNNIFSSGQQEEAADKTINPSEAGTKSVSSGITQTVEMHVTSSGFQPAALKIKKNVPVEWTIHGDSVSGCTSKIIIPELNIEKNINSGKNIINFTPTTAGEIPFSCWMGMVRGKFTVE